MTTNSYAQKRKPTNNNDDVGLPSKKIRLMNDNDNVDGQYDNILNIDETKINDIKKIKIKQPKINGTSSDYISGADLLHLLANKDSSYVIIDVRDESNDYLGGNIIGSINISEKVFYNQIADIITAYNNFNKLIIYDMYGVRRCIKCCEYYDNAINELILNYDSISCKSFYYKYSLHDNVNTNILSDCSIISLKNTNNVKKTRIDINNLNDNIICNLRSQSLYVLRGGYFELINSSLIDIFHTNLINNLDLSKYEQLQLVGVYDKTMWYHQNEFFAKDKFLEIKKKQKSANFKLNSSLRSLR